MIKKISLLVLVLLITGSIDSIRNLPATSLFGTQLIFFLIFAAVVFLIPVSLVSAELSSTLPEKGGVYYWVRMALGEKMGFLSIWLQWINTMVWYPTILSFVAGTLAYLIDPKLAQNKEYLVVVILVVFWVMTLINLKGLHVSAKFAAVCTVIGFIIPVVFIITLGFVWFFGSQVSSIHFTSHNVLPHLGQTNNWISLTAIIASFLGMELASVHVNQVKNPQKNFPISLLISVVVILITMAFGALSIAVVLPHNSISLVSGVMEAFTHFFAAYHILWLIPILTVMLLLGSLGGMVNWIISPAKGLLQAAEHGYMPKFLSKQNKHGVAANLLILQAVLVSFVCLAFLLMPSVNGSYWFLTDLSTQLYLLMYVLMFVAAFVLKFKISHLKAPFKIPGGSFGMGFVCLLGLFGSIISMIVGFFPPDNLKVGGVFHYEMSFIIGLVVMIVPVFLFYGYKKFKA